MKQWCLGSGDNYWPFSGLFNLPKAQGSIFGIWIGLFVYYLEPFLKYFYGMGYTFYPGTLHFNKLLVCKLTTQGKSLVNSVGWLY